MGSKGGRPPKTVTPELAAEARRLLGRYLHRSRVVQTLMERHPDMGRPTAYRCVEAALKEFREELAGKGEVDALTLAYAGLVEVASSEEARPKERVGALVGLIRLLGVKAVGSLTEADEIADFLAQIQARKLARAGEPKPVQEPEGAERVE